MIVAVGTWLAMTVSVAAWLVTLPTALVTVTRNCAPLSADWALLSV